MLERHHLLPGGEGAQLMRMHSSSLADLHQQLAGVEEAAAGHNNNCSIAFPLDLVELAEPAPSTSGSEGTTVRAALVTCHDKALEIWASCLFWYSLSACLRSS